MRFTLRTMFAVVTLACVALSFVAWRQIRQRRLTNLVQAYSVAIDNQRYDEASLIADRAHKEFPNEVVIQVICEQSQMIQSLKRGEKVEFTCECPDMNEGSATPVANMDISR